MVRSRYARGTVELRFRFGALPVRCGSLTFQRDIHPLRPRNGSLRTQLSKSGRANWTMTAKPSLGWTASRKSWQARG